MERKYLNDLIAWLNDDLRKPLIVYGARQVGKTTLIRDIFAKEYFKGNYIYIDCKKNLDFVNFCYNHIDPKEIIDYLSLKENKVIDKNTLIIFDEIQECLPLITSLKYFYDDFREIPVIATGSMVRIKIQREGRHRGVSSNNKFLFPIGKINELTIYQLNFEEYLINRNKVLYDKLFNSFNAKIQLEPYIHELALKTFYEYLLIGGMPETVNQFLKTQNYQKSRKLLKDLYSDYLADMDLYQASPESIVRSKKIYENIFNELNKESKNFKSSLIEKDSSNRDMRSPIDWLTLSYIVNKSLLVKEKVTIPLIDSDENLFRLYLSDVGIFSFQSNVNPITFIDKNSNNTLSGIFYENYVASELTIGGYKLFYWKGKNNAEFEFITEYGSNIIPIEVKKSKGTLSSLEKFKNHNKLFVAIKISENYLGFNEENKILTIPFYYVSFFVNTLKDASLEKLIKS